ncbi:hypothetical protein LWE61_05370 [Sphingobium sufflavum]|uniref:hypothetical protein n=1 Tax=Sphingobium sufflavum TaxID=1129547 RepID=UPI001F415048|nr:hypothetical protein [Sphingobium sufflavum]MCE7795990.1 hypothetical protein [Sphingobium sufflavum]
MAGLTLLVAVLMLLASHGLSRLVRRVEPWRGTGHRRAKDGAPGVCGDSAQSGADDGGRARP